MSTLWPVHSCFLHQHLSLVRLPISVWDVFTIGARALAPKVAAKWEFLLGGSGQLVSPTLLLFSLMSVKVLVHAGHLSVERV